MNRQRYDDPFWIDTLEWAPPTFPVFPPLDPESCYNIASAPSVPPALKLGGVVLKVELAAGAVAGQPTTVELDGLRLPTQVTRATVGGLEATVDACTDTTTTITVSGDGGDPNLADVHLFGADGQEVDLSWPKLSNGRKLPVTTAELFETTAVPGGSMHALVIAAAALAAMATATTSGDRRAAADNMASTASAPAAAAASSRSARADRVVGRQNTAVGCLKAPPGSDDGVLHTLWRLGLDATLRSTPAALAFGRVGHVLPNGNCLLYAAAVTLNERGLLAHHGLSTAVATTGMLEQAAAALRQRTAARMQSAMFQACNRHQAPGDDQHGTQFASFEEEAAAFGVDRQYATPLAVLALADILGRELQVVQVYGAGAGHVELYAPTTELSSGDNDGEPLKLVWDCHGVHFWAVVAHNRVLR